MEKTLPRKQNKELVPYAKELRKNMTREEKHLWYDFLKSYSVKFTRQKVFGNYIADFYSSEANMIIELDGSQHHSLERKDYDEKRTAFFNEYGVIVLRINNSEVNRNFDDVCKYIDGLVKTRIRNK
jgi:very-short-patch-repair endonuclease